MKRSNLDATASSSLSLALAHLALLLAGCGSHVPPPEPDLAPEPVWYRVPKGAPDAVTPEASPDRRDSRPPSGGDRGPDLSGEVRLDRLILLAFARNPALKAARERYRAAVAAWDEAVGLPDPQVQWTTRPEPVQTRTGPQTDVYQLSQGIPFPGKLALKGQVAVDEARIARQTFFLATRDLVAELKQAYFELAYLDQAVGIVRRTQDLAQHLATAARRGLAENAEVRQDQVTLTDALKAEAQLAQLSYDLAALLEQRAAEEARINRILNRSPRATVGQPLSLAFRELDLSREQLEELALRHRQELRIALLRLQKAGKLKDLADLSWAPDFFVGGSLLATGSPIMPTPDAGEDAWGITFGLTLPIWGAKNQSRIARAEHQRRAAIRDRQDLFNRTLEQVSRLFFRLSNTRRLVVLYRDQLVPQARSAMGMAEQWQQVGRDDLGRVLEAQGVWLNFNLALARSLADHQQTIAALEQIVGMPLGAFLAEPPAEEEKDR